MCGVLRLALYSPLLLVVLNLTNTASAISLHDFADFIPAHLDSSPFLRESFLQPQNLTSPLPPDFSPLKHDSLLQRRQSSPCGSSYSSCGNLGAPGLCCTTAAVCSADYAGTVACCPIGAACTGTVGPYAVNAGTTTQTFVLATTTTTAQAIATVTPPTGGFIAAAGTTVAVLPGGVPSMNDKAGRSAFLGGAGAVLGTFLMCQ